MVTTKTEHTLLCELETLLRDFSTYVDTKLNENFRRGNEVQPFAPRTLEMLGQAREVMNKLDDLRERSASQNAPRQSAI